MASSSLSKSPRSWLGPIGRHSRICEKTAPIGPSKREFAGEQLVEDDAKAETHRSSGPPVFPGPARAPCTQAFQKKRCGDQTVVMDLPSQAEVHEDRLTMLVDHDIGGFYVTMEEAGLVHGSQCLGDLSHQFGKLQDRGLSIQQPLIQGTAVDQGMEM